MVLYAAFLASKRVSNDRPSCAVAHDHAEIHGRPTGGWCRLGASGEEDAVAA